MTVLVTGATGFVGRQLCPALHARGNSLRMVVRRELDQSDPLCTLGQITHSGDLDPKTGWNAALHGVSAIVHLAGLAHVMGKSATAAEPLYQRINVETTRTLAQAAADAGVKRFIFISSVKAVGERGAFDQASVPAPADAYGRSKLAAENALKEIAQYSGMSVIILRPPLIYGPDVGANFLRLLGLVDRGLPLPLASIDNRRSLLYVGNLVSAIQRCLEDGSARSGSYFVSDGSAVSTPDLIRAMAGALARPARLWPFPPVLLRVLAHAVGREGEIARLTDLLVVDDAPFRNTFDWIPPVTMNDGLGETVYWYRNIR